MDPETELKAPVKAAMIRWKCGSHGYKDTLLLRVFSKYSSQHKFLCKGVCVLLRNPPDSYDNRHPRSVEKVLDRTSTKKCVSLSQLQPVVFGDFRASVSHAQLLCSRIIRSFRSGVTVSFLAHEKELADTRTTSASRCSCVGVAVGQTTEDRAVLWREWSECYNVAPRSVARPLRRGRSQLQTCFF